MGYFSTFQTTRRGGVPTRRSRSMSETKSTEPQSNDQPLIKRYPITPSQSQDPKGRMSDGRHCVRTFRKQF